MKTGLLVAVSLAGFAAAVQGSTLVLVDEFTIVKNSLNNIIFQDTFDNGVPPPDTGGNTQSYAVNGEPLGPESGGKLTLDAESGEAVMRPDVGSMRRQGARVKTNIDPDQPTQGLRIDDTFSVSGIFDLMLPTRIRERYGVRLTDKGSEFREDGLGISVMRTSTSLIEIVFHRNNRITDVFTDLDSVALESNHDQIELTLSRLDADNSEITASFAYVDVGIKGNAITFSTTASIFNGEDFTRGAFSYSAPVPPVLVSAVLPASRSVQLGDAATAFATVINTGSETATGCSIAPLTSVPASFTYQTTDPATNALTGAPNTPVDIATGPNGFQSFILAFTPTQDIAPTDVQLSYDCTNTNPAPVTVGLNTLLLSASTTPVPDIVALAATPTGDGIVNLSGTNGSNAFAVATVNVGSTDTITASAVVKVSLPLFLSICETNPATGACLSGPANSVTSSVSAGATPTYSIFVTATGTVPFDPANNRIVVEFKDAGSVVRGSTSVAVRTL